MCAALLFNRQLSSSCYRMSILFKAPRQLLSHRARQSCFNSSRFGTRRSPCTAHRVLAARILSGVTLAHNGKAQTLPRLQVGFSVSSNRRCWERRWSAACEASRDERGPNSANSSSLGARTSTSAACGSLSTSTHALRSRLCRDAGSHPKKNPRSRKGRLEPLRPPSPDTDACPPSNLFDKRMCDL